MLRQYRQGLALAVLLNARGKGGYEEPQRGFEPTNLPITSRLRYHCATGAYPLYINAYRNMAPTLRGHTQTACVHMHSSLKLPQLSIY